MTELLENVELADKNTFRLPAKARYYAEFSTVEELKDLLGRPEVAGLPVFILGGGSTGDNVYELLQQFDGVCVGAWIKDGDLLNPVNPDRARRYMEQVERARA